MVLPSKATTPTSTGSSRSKASASPRVSLSLKLATPSSPNRHILVTVPVGARHALPFKYRSLCLNQPDRLPLTHLAGYNTSQTNPTKGEPTHVNAHAPRLLHHHPPGRQQHRHRSTRRNRS